MITMKISELVNELKSQEFKLGNLLTSEMYSKIQHDEVVFAGYTRISSNKINGESINNQKSIIFNFVNCMDQSSKINFYEDIESGTNLDRPGLLRMLNDIQRGKVNVVLVTRANRLGRDCTEMLDIIYNQFYANNVIFVALNNFLVNALDNRIVFIKAFAEAEDYCSETSKIVKRSLRNKMMSGSLISSKALFGYKIEEFIEIQNGISIKKRRLMPANDSSTEIIKTIFNKFIKGKGYATIAKELNNEGIVSPKGGKWCPNTIKSILNNPKYAGCLYQGIYSKQGYRNTGDDKKIKKLNSSEWIFGGTFQGIISKDIFDNVQQEIKSRRNNFRYKTEPHIFAGLLKCADCGSSMIYKQRDKGYKCSNSQKGGKLCSTHFVKEKDLLTLIIDSIKEKTIQYRHEFEELLIKEAREQLLLDNSKSILKMYEKQEKELIDCISDMYCDYRKGVLSELLFIDMQKVKSQELEKIKMEKRKLEEKNKKIERLKDHVESIVERFLSFNNVNNSILRTFIKEIVVSESGNITVKWNFPNKWFKNCA